MKQRPPDKYVCGSPHWYVNCGKCGERMLNGSTERALCEECLRGGVRPGFGGGKESGQRADSAYHGGYHE